MTLNISLLGEPEISRDGQEIILPGYRPLALLAYLLLTGKAHSRQHLVDLLFDRPADPRAALRWTLSQLRKAIGAELIEADRKEIGFNFAGDFQLDVNDFEAGNLDLYRGELLQGIDLRDALSFEAWLLIERERLRSQYQKRLDDQVVSAHAAGNMAIVERSALRLLEMDNLREDWHRYLMEAYAAQGRFEAAGAQYELCRQALYEELNIEPSPETLSLADSIKQQQVAYYRTVAAEVGPPNMVRDPAASSPPADHTPSTQAEPEKPVVNRPPLWSWRTFAAGAVFTLLTLLGVLLFDAGGGSTEQAAAITDETVQTSSAGSFTGTAVSIGSLLDSGRPIFKESLEPFEEKTGITIKLIAYEDDFEQIIPSIIDSGLRPDIIFIPQPGLVADLLRQGEVVDISTFMDDDFLKEQYSPALLEAATLDGQMAGVWVNISVKSIVWYPKRTFDAAGYEIPETWNELLALTEEIAADGHAPWCIGIEDGAASGWVGTDWIENILLRTAPPETFDAWAAGDLTFDSPEIEAAFEKMGEIWLEDRYVYGGVSNISNEETLSAVTPMFEDPPGCYLTQLGSFAPFIFPEEAISGEDYDLFYLPPIDPAYGKPILGGGDLAIMLDDRPEVREVMRHLATGASVRRLVEEGFYISPHKDAHLDWYATPSQLKVAQILLEADTYRFDASDLMPPEVGTGSFWLGIVEWVEGKDLETVLREIDASWPE